MKGHNLAALCFCSAALAAAATPAPVLPDALRACAEIVDGRERLACYDRLAGGVSGAGAGQTGAAPPTAPAPAPGADQPAATATAIPVVPPGAGPAAAAAPARTVPPAVPQPAAGGTPAASIRESFGSYEAEHPAPPPVALSIVARVEVLGRSAGGRPTATLEGGQVWELDESDPLLSVGDTVRIRRAAFGSFLLETPTKRMHRARRLR